LRLDSIFLKLNIVKLFYILGVNCSLKGEREIKIKTFFLKKERRKEKKQRKKNKKKFKKKK